MKRVFNFILATLCVISYTACTDDEGIEYIQESSVKIVSRDVTFPAAASQGSITVEAPGTFTVSTSDTGWCSTTISGSTIQVNVEQNPGLEGRSSMLTIRCGADTASVAIIQSGVIFDLSAGSQIVAGNEPGMYSYDLKCNTDLVLTSSEDWISVINDKEEEKLHVTLKENNTGHLRKGSITYTAGSYEDHINIVQYDFDKELAGDYMLVFTDMTSGMLQYFDVTLSRTGNAYSIDLPALGLNIPVTLNGAALVLRGGEPIGIIGSYYVYTTIWDTNEGYLTWSNSISMSATFDYAEEAGVGYTTAVFKDDGSWLPRHPDAIRLEAFSTANATSATRLGSLVTLWNPYLIKEHGETNTVTYRMSETPMKANISLLPR